MAPEKKDKKRKAATTTAAADSPAKKTKKVEGKASEPTKETPKPILKKNKANSATAEGKSAAKPKANGDVPRPIKPRKRAADFLSDDEEGSDVEVDDTPVVEKNTKKPSNKKSKQEDGTAAPAPAEKPVKSSKKTTSKGKKAEKVEIVASDSEEGEQEVSDDSEEEEDDDQTTALIRGFESSGDEDESADEGFDPDAPVPKIPDSKKAKRKILKMQKQAKSESNEEPGTVYVGRIPHGFYEHQMRAYFSQFGDITKLRLSRNRVTGRSKHYAFIEFSSTSVAKIVAGTMDNYLMYGHILKCKYVPPAQLHPEIWKGANRRFKHTPWNRIEKKRLEKGKTREQWTKRIEGEQKKRLVKAAKLKELGYEFEMPALKSVDEVPVQEPKTVEEGEQAKAIEAPAPEAAPVEEAEPEKKVDDTPKKKSKKEKKTAPSPAAEKGTPKSISKASPKVAKETVASPATRSKGKSKAKARA